MGSTAIRNSGALLLGALLALPAFAHPQGFHTKLTVTVTKGRVSALVVMDVDAGERCLLLREAADSNRDGVLSGEELSVLKDRLVKLVTRPLKFGLSGATLPLEVKDTKLSLREDRRANDSPLSVAVLLELDHQDALRQGMSLEVEDTSPDQSAIVLQVFQPGAPTFEAEVPSGVKQRVRLGALK